MSPFLYIIEYPLQSISVLQGTNKLIIRGSTLVGCNPSMPVAPILIHDYNVVAGPFSGAAPRWSSM